MRGGIWVRVWILIQSIRVSLWRWRGRWRGRMRRLRSISRLLQVSQIRIRRSQGRIRRLLMGLSRLLAGWAVCRSKEMSLRLAMWICWLWGIKGGWIMKRPRSTPLASLSLMMRMRHVESRGKTIFKRPWKWTVLWMMAMGIRMMGMKIIRKDWRD